jgi:spoIIIJ-associated protein
MTFREFTGKNVEEAIRSAMKDFDAELGDLDIEILSQGSRGLLGVGGEEARILAAPKSAVAAAETIRAVPDEAPADDLPEAAAAPDIDAGAAIIDDGDDQVAELARADTARRSRGGRTRGGRGRGGRERERAVREPRAERPPREPRADRPAREPAPFVSGKPAEELSDEERATLETAQTVLTEMIALMGLDATVEITRGGDTARLNVKGDDLGALIGRRGEKLASLQHIVNLIVGRREGQHHRIAIDVENYRGRREEQLRDVADRAAKRVIQSGKIIQLEAMPAIERRVVHMALLENPKVRTQSVGVEPNRRIVVLPANKAEA